MDLFFQGKGPVSRQQIAGLLKSGKAAYAGIVALELVNGAKSRKELEVLYDAFDTMRCVPVSETTFLSAGRLGYEIARKGHTLSAVDLLIAQTAIENGVSLMTYDDHFSIIARHSALTLLK